MKLQLEIGWISGAQRLETGVRATLAPSKSNKICLEGYKKPLTST